MFWGYVVIYGEENKRKSEINLRLVYDFFNGIYL